MVVFSMADVYAAGAAFVLRSSTDIRGFDDPAGHHKKHGSSEFGFWSCFLVHGDDLVHP